MISTVTFSQISLNIEIIEMRNNTGNIILQLFNGKGEVLTFDVSKIKDKKCTVSFKNLTPGKFAVRYYHDENLNSRMETNIFGKPTEGYGFSNDVTEKFGPPPFEKWLFGIKGDTTIILKPTY